MVRMQSLAPSLKRRFQRLFGPKVEVIWIPSSELDCIVGELGWLEDIVFEMAMKARAAMPFGGRLVIESANLHIDESTGTNDLRPGRYVMFEMTCLRQNPADTDLVESSVALMEPFPDTLLCDSSQVQVTLRGHGGQICEYNEPGRALTIRAFFPSAEGDSKLAPSLTMVEGSKAQKILLVEDEGYVRDVACEILQSEGYEVFAARTGTDALRIVEQHGPVHLLVTDVIMPGINGKQLSEQLTSRHPNLKTIYMSGYNEGVPVVSSVMETDCTFLQKPFTLEHLTTKVKEVLESPAC